MIIDLHTHSYYSADGQYSISELLDFFSAGDIAGITDHETIGGWEEFKIEAQKRDIRPVLGVEWFTPTCHILSYFINEIPQDFFDFMVARRNLDKNCMFLVYQDIKKKIPTLPSYEKVLALNHHPEGILGLPALAEAVSFNSTNLSQIEAEDLVRKEKRKLPMGTVRPMPFDPEELIEIINSWGATPILAHPYRKSGGQTGRRSKDEVELRVRTLVKAGLKGVEFFSGGSTEDEVKHILSLTGELGLIPTIGSDKHSPGKTAEVAKVEKFNDLAMKRIMEWLTLSI
ncbi:hypothetical protein KAR28_03250 [Candidatus Parcubacteria bacterium]|nr:hypothetical protein [Candidatus Parcubacteria bacterium]